MKNRLLHVSVVASLLVSGSAFAGDYVWSTYKSGDYVSRRGGTATVVYQPSNFMVSPVGKTITGVQVQLQDSSQANVSMSLCYNGSFECYPIAYDGRVFTMFNGKLADKPFTVKYTGTGLGPYPRYILATMVVYYND
ncbi:hypothetical protein ACOTB3_27875 [Achromobacter xylosoxidans]|uniref:hypothetical protein n=1 Tax=Alcaligenes xylosoxydans xylosoxydans TaxID=85698 RepID=UPI0012A8A48C|nr:hypothetical protein [Achromobacter xylosoxidans]CUR65441.1 hypothetical protein BN2877_08350 [Achromobacter xylosoxidans]